MSEVVRRGVFETNSSSSHVLSIGWGEFGADRIPLDDGVCRIYPGEFGWGYERYQDAASKASYCLTYAMGGYDGAKKNAAQLEMLRRVVSVSVDAPVEFCPHEKMRDWDYEWGYIDHQSNKGEGDYCAVAFESDEALRAFIFNPASVLIIDNDNH